MMVVTRLKYLFIILLASCVSIPKTEYTSWSDNVASKGVIITCIYCDPVESQWDLPRDTTKTDSSFEWMAVRLKQINDSISLIVHQNQWLDSVNKTIDTVKWSPLYYKPKKKK